MSNKEILFSWGDGKQVMGVQRRGPANTRGRSGGKQIKQKEDNT